MKSDRPDCLKIAVWPHDARGFDDSARGCFDFRALHQLTIAERFAYRIAALGERRLPRSILQTFLAR